MTVTLVRILKNLIMAGYSPEHDVCGVSDPFLQVKILRLLRLFGYNDSEASETMTDILAQVATNTESSKNVGNAILYETVLSIMDIKSEPGLRVLGINILGRFLLNTDKNIRFVALNTLQKTVQADYNAVQRHRSTIVECLKDADVSIRKKAMSLCFSLINGNNIKNMTKELLVFLDKADPEFKSLCSSKLCLCAEQYSPGTKWQIDTVISVLKTAGNYVRDDVVGNLIQLISENTSLHSYTVHQLWSQLQGDLQSKQPLIQVTCWTIGEFGDLLLTPDPEVASTEVITEDLVIERLEKVATNNLLNLVTKEYCVLALVKLSVRYPSRAASIKTITDAFTCHLNSELQQRATEFSALFTRHDSLMPSVLEKMPPMKPSERKLQNGQINNEINQDTTNTEGNLINDLMNGDADASTLLSIADTSSPTSPSGNSRGKYDALADIMGLDLASNLDSPTPGEISKSSIVNDVLGLFDELGIETGQNSLQITPHPPAPPTVSSNMLGTSDLSSLLTSFPQPQVSPVSPAAAAAAVSSVNRPAPPPPLNLDSLLSPLESFNEIPPVSSKHSLVALNKDGLHIEMSCEKSSIDSSAIIIEMLAGNSTPFVMTDFLFQAAVPKVNINCSTQMICHVSLSLTFNLPLSFFLSRSLSLFSYHHPAIIPFRLEAHLSSKASQYTIQIR